MNDEILNYISEYNQSFEYVLYNTLKKHKPNASYKDMEDYESVDQKMQVEVHREIVNLVAEKINKQPNDFDYLDGFFDTMDLNIEKRLTKYEAYREIASYFDDDSDSDDSDSDSDDERQKKLIRW